MQRERLTFLLMGIFFLLFGVMTVNIFVLLKPNIDLFVDCGRMANGALVSTGPVDRLRIPELVFSTLFKTCEHVLVRRLAGEPAEWRRALTRAKLISAPAVSTQ